MARIVLGLGSSHSPMLNMQPDEWPGYEERERAGYIPLLDRKGQPVAFDARVAAADPRVAGCIDPAERVRRHRRTEAAIARLGAILDGAALDALIVIGDDQFELFDRSNQPAMLLYCGPTIRNAPFEDHDARPLIGGARPGFECPDDRPQRRKPGPAGSSAAATADSADSRY